MSKALREIYSNVIDEDSGDQGNYSVLVSAFSTAQWMMVSRLIWTMQLSFLTT